MKPLPEEVQVNLERILGHLYSVKEPELQEGVKESAYGILSNWEKKGYDVRRYWAEAKRVLGGVMAIALISLTPYSAFAQPGIKPIEYMCQPTIKDDKLVEEYYGIYKHNGTRIIVKLDEIVIKKDAKPEDIKGYKCKERKEVDGK